MSVSDLMMERYFAMSCPSGSGMALLTSCRDFAAASESAAVLLQGTYPVGAAGRVSGSLGHGRRCSAY